MPDEGTNQTLDAVVFALGDAKFWLLLAVNIAAVIIAYRLKLPIAGLVFVYWMHGLVVLAMHVLRMRALGLKTRDVVVFSGWFHLFFVVFVLAAARGKVGGPGALAICAAGFLIYQLFVLQRTLKDDAEVPPNARLLALFPFLRVFSMTGIMIVGLLVIVNDAIGPVALVAFGAMKTLTDAVIHITEAYLVDITPKGD